MWGFELIEFGVHMLNVEVLKVVDRMMSVFHNELE